jgi:hypothetical protein
LCNATLSTSLFPFAKTAGHYQAAGGMSLAALWLFCYVSIFVRAKPGCQPWF